MNEHLVGRGVQDARRSLAELEATWDDGVTPDTKQGNLEFYTSVCARFLTVCLLPLCT